MSDDNERLANEVHGRTVGTRAIRHRATVIVVLGIVGIVVLYIFSLTMGAYHIGFFEAFDQMKEVITSWGKPEDVSGKVIYHLRMPRSIAVLLVGGGLAVAGAVMQALIHNPLVDPYVTGVSSGASFGVVVMTLGGAITVGSLATMWLIPVGAIIGAVGAFLLTMSVAEAAGGKAMSYVLGGTIMASGLSAGTTLIMYYNADKIQHITAWMFGSFSSIQWDDVYVMTIPIVAIIAFIIYQARNLNVMLLGETQAQYLGMNARTYKRNMLILTAILTAFCVAYCGVIGFLGLIIPHLCRMVVGGDHRVLIPTSVVVGGLVLLVADIVCKSNTGGELPIGAIISVIGVPFFIFLMVKEGKKYVM
ncbi:ABC-type Fe3+-siderophore transport system, permease component [Thermoplasmatales archaeon BRNA1]|nr:ABC-type Fe3+-siderophore transport system, permease component [Thermoplasmatales archaeon BRNA1]